MDKAWAGLDAGKEFHRAHVLNASGRKLLSQKGQNDEADISKLIVETLSFTEEVVWDYLTTTLMQRRVRIP